MGNRGAFPERTVSIAAEPTKVSFAAATTASFLPDDIAAAYRPCVQPEHTHRCLHGRSTQSSGSHRQITQVPVCSPAASRYFAADDSVEPSCDAAAAAPDGFVELLLAGSFVL